MIKWIKNWIGFFKKDINEYDISLYLFENYEIHPLTDSMKIAFLYGLIGIIWIAFPDELISRLTHDSANFWKINIYKGWAYVGLTVVLIFTLVSKRLLLFKKALESAKKGIRKEKETERELHFLAYYDTLTGLPNRTLFELTVSKLIEENKGEKHALLYMDIDNFKNINDTFGHAAGDSLLIHISTLLKTYMSGNVFVSRLGGDEFAVILMNIKDKQEVINQIQNLHGVIKQPWIHENQEFYESVSIGVAIYPDHGDTLSLLLRNSDIAMYHIKKNLKDNYFFYAEELQAKNLKHITIVNEMHHALENQEFQLYYQPILDLNTSTLNGVEALIRWIHPEKGVISPAEFIPAAEESGLINQIGDWVMKTALYQKKEWEEKGYPHLKMSINVSGRSLIQPDFIEKVATLMEETKVNCDEIQLEITETVLIQKMNTSKKVLDEISKMGIRIALDDFGTGYSSLTYLRNLPIDVVKLDGTFIKGLLDNGQDSVIVESVIQLTHDLDLQMVAEGIETEKQLSILKMNSCDYGQGYLFSKPLPQSAIEEIMNRSLNKQLA